ncbi:MAG: PAS domain S-box protein [Anaerolineae bacterium]|nr:PAS domain S-box protein [Anaerolineae bacterium]
MKQPAEKTIKKLYRYIFLNTYTWLWTVVILAALVCGMISWVHYQYQELSEKTSFNLGEIRQARVDLAKGFLYLNLTNDPSTIFNRDEGLALINQSINTIEYILDETDQERDSLFSLHVIDVKTRDVFEADIQAFKKCLADWNGARTDKAAATSLRISYAELERQAEQMDINVLLSLKNRWNELDDVFIIVLWTAAFLLMGLCVLIFVAVRAREKSAVDLRESEERFRTIIENSSAGYFKIDLDGKYRVVNRAWLLMHGYDSVDEVIGQPFSITQVDDALDGARQKVDGSLQGDIVRSGEFSRLCKDGSIGYHIYSLTPVKKDNQIVAVEGFLIDTTERKRAEEALRELNEALEQRVMERTDQLEKANRELKSFNYSVSHDLRSPIRTINGYSQILMEDYGAVMEAEAARLLDRIHSETVRMGKLIDHLLQLSTASNAEMRSAEVNLSDLVQKVDNRLQDENPQVKINFVVAPDLKITADPDLLEILLNNLLGNAVKFSLKKPLPVVEFGVMDGEKGRVYFVRDNGAGFDMTQAQRIFEAFQRVHNSVEFPGNGIGLAIVQRIVKRYNGEIWAESQLDQGATFYFTLKETEI